MTAKELIPNLRRESFGNVVSLIRSSNLISSGLFSHTKSAKAKELKFLVMTGGYSHQFWQLTCSVWGRVVLSWRWDWPRWGVRCEVWGCWLFTHIWYLPVWCVPTRLTAFYLSHICCLPANISPWSVVTRTDNTRTHATGVEGWSIKNICICWLTSISCIHFPLFHFKREKLQ